MPQSDARFLPPQMAVRNWITDRWRRVSLRNGFQEYDGPIFENLELYRVESRDEIVNDLFRFTDRGDRQFAIRPEMTPTLARMAAELGLTAAQHNMLLTLGEANGTEGLERVGRLLAGHPEGPTRLATVERLFDLLE